MQRIGILGGLSAESTTYYCERIIRGYTQRYGRPGYPEIIIYSVTFDDYAQWQERGEWDRSAEHMAAYRGWPQLGPTLRSLPPTQCTKCFPWWLRVFPSRY